MKVKRLHTDGAKEQDSAKLRQFLDDNGTNATHTTPNTSQSNAFAEQRFRKLMAAARTAMDASSRMPKRFWSHTVLDAADKWNYMATAKEGKLKPRPHKTISSQCPDYFIPSPATLLPWGNIGRAVSAEKFKKQLDTRADNACYLRKSGTRTAEIWLPEPNKVTTFRYTDFIVQKNIVRETGDTCDRNKDDIQTPVDRRKDANTSKTDINAKKRHMPALTRPPRVKNTHMKRPQTVATEITRVENENPSEMRQDIWEPQKETRSSSHQNSYKEAQGDHQRHGRRQCVRLCGTRNGHRYKQPGKVSVR